MSGAKGRTARAGVVLTLLAIVAMAVAPGCSAKKKRPVRKTSEEQYQIALKLMDKKKYAKAREALGNIGIRELQETSLDPLVKLTLADAYYLDSGITNVIEAQSRYEQFLNFYPSNEKAPYAQFQVGMCLFQQSAKPYNDQEYTRKALAEFEKVHGIDPASEYVARAETMIAKCTDKLARHEFDVGRFYMKRGACEAAAGRFRSILNDYPHYANVDAAYYFLGQSLLCSNNAEEGKIYFEKLIEDYPESEYAAKAKEARATLGG